MELHGLYNKYMYYPSDFNLRFISLNYKDIDSKYRDCKSPFSDKKKKMFNQTQYTCSLFCFSIGKGIQMWQLQL